MMDGMAADSGFRLVVRMHGVRDLPPKLAGRRVYAKVTLNSQYKRTESARCVPQNEGRVGAAFDSDRVMPGWGVKSINNVSFDDLMVIRIKMEASLGRGVSLGVATIAVRQVSTFGTRDAIAWFPLSP